MKQHRGPKKKTISISNFTGMNRQQSSNNSIQEISGLAYQLQIIIIIIIIIRREHKRKMGKRGVGVGGRGHCTQSHTVTNGTDHVWVLVSMLLLRIYIFTSSLSFFPFLIQ